jgi:nucleosome assembly protein 1-like 1
LQKRDELEESSTSEIDIINDKYDLQYINIYNKINAIVKGVTDISDQITPEDKEKYSIKDNEDGATAATGTEIKDYWSKVIKNSKYFTINSKDEKILAYLTNVTYEKIEEGKKDFKITFEFSANEYMDNDKIVKEYNFNKDKELTGAKSTEIKWKSDDCNPTKELKKKEIKKGKKKQVKTLLKDVDSFFSTFKQNDDNLTILDDEVSFFEEEFFANQLELYLNLESSKKFDADDDEDDDDEDDDDDDDDEDDDGKDKKKKKAKKGKQGDDKKEKKEECKNQ